jgi:putative intracellular protease/amidase
MNDLHNIKVAILSENGFEESELFSPKAALEEAGATQGNACFADSRYVWTYRRDGEKRWYRI